jgi:hypothetical protein
MTISTGAGTPLGTFQISINGSVAGGPTRTQTLSLTVRTGSTSNPDFAIAVSNPSLTANPNEAVVFNGTLTASDGYKSAVNLRCSGAVPLTCTPSPAILVPSTAGAPFTVTASNDAQNHFNFTIDATGTDAAQIHKSAPVELIVAFNFVLNNNSAAQTIKAGQTASYNLDVLPLGNGSVFPANVTLSCSTATLPPLTTCSFTPSLVAAGQGDTNVVVKLQTTAASVSQLAAPHALWYDLGVSLAAIIALGGLKQPRRRRKKKYLRLVILGMLLTLLIACGGGSSGPGGGGGGGGGGGAGHPGTTPGNYTITVTGAVGSVTRNVDVALTVQ